MTRPGHRARPQSSGARPVSVSRAGHRGHKTREGQDPDTEPGHRARPQSSWARPREGGGQKKDKRSTRGGQDLDRAKTRTRGGQDPDTEPGHRFGAASECGQLFFPKIEPQQ